MLTLYHDPVSSNSWKVRIVLAEKRIPYEAVQLDVRRDRRHKEPEYLNIHPYGQVPAIVDDGLAVYDSTLINEYLEDAYPEVPLMPRDPRGRARVRALEDFRDQHYHVDFFPLLRQLRDRPPGEANASIVEEAWAAVQRHMERLEAELGDNAYLTGAFSIADAAFIPNFAYQEHWRLETPARFPRVRAWLERCQARPSYTAAYGL
jgi:glutathione S-transferase